MKFSVRRLSLAAAAAALGSQAATAAPTIVEMPLGCVANMENGGHAMKQGPRGTNMLVLKDASGKKLAVVYTDITWIQRAKRINTSALYPAVMAVSDPVDWVSSEIETGSVSGQISAVMDLCMRADFSAAPDASTCRAAPPYGVHGGGGETVDRPFQVTNMPVTVKVDDSGKGKVLRIISYDGSLPAHSARDALVLSCVHPLYVPYLQGVTLVGDAPVAAPGAKTYAAAGAYQGKTFNDYQSPLVVDMDGDQRLDLVDVLDETRPVMFDADGTGKPIRSGWVGPKDALLTLDVDGDGRITSGRELFGEFTHAAHDAKRDAWFRRYHNGFEALAQYDLNLDGRIDAGDAVFAKLRLWRDANGDGVSQPGELLTTSAAGVVAFDLAYAMTSNSGDFPRVAGNEVRFTATVRMKDGGDRLVADVWFRYLRNVSASTPATRAATR